MTPCNWEASHLCKTYKSYITVGSANYHGELCGGCLWWQDAPEDTAFKERIAEITGKKGVHGDNRRGN